MIACPKCSTWCRVIRTSTQPGNVVRRVLECANQHRFVTVETVLRMLPVKGGRE